MSILLRAFIEFGARPQLSELCADLPIIKASK
jgi:hypothetical protein